jgi:Fe-S cluster biogenesis protein NfuA
MMQMSMIDQNINTNPHINSFELAVASFLSGPVSKILAIHAGFVHLTRIESSVVYVNLGGGCTTCPQSSETLKNIVLRQLQDRFGEDVIQSVVLASGVKSTHA